ncbi:hypothetical protein [Paraburkholderia sacchari]|uniref:hypothetical protein n=1 Tax=Paraburkholderia sacchari TaxID=159450 RepID=UPI003D990A00
MNEFEHQRVLRSEREHAAATEALTTVEAEVAAFQSRIAEKLAARAHVVDDVRAGKLDEQTAALRLAIVDADASDLESLLLDAKQRVAAALSKVEETSHTLRMASDALVALERAETERALDAKIREIERKLLIALAERYRVSGRTDRRVFGFWQASLELRDAVNGSLPNL